MAFRRSMDESVARAESAELEKKRIEEEQKKRVNDFREWLKQESKEKKVICLETSEVWRKEIACNYLLEEEFVCVQNSFNRYTYILTFVRKGDMNFFVTPQFIVNK